MVIGRDDEEMFRDVTGFKFEFGFEFEGELYSFGVLKLLIKTVPRFYNEELAIFFDKL